MAARRDYVLPTIQLDRSAPQPLHRQLRDQIARAIAKQALPKDSRLPPTRTLARLLGVSRNTVLFAYDELAAEGLIRGEHGSGMRVIAGTPHISTRRLMQGLKEAVRAAQYPARTLDFTDRDGNSLYLNF